MTRRSFNDIAKGVASPEPEVSRKRSFACAAFDCPRAGTISTTAASSGRGTEPTWLCGEHYGRPASEWPSITRSLNSPVPKTPRTGVSPLVARMRQALKAQTGPGPMANLLPSAEREKA